MKHLKYISTLALILAVVDVGAHAQIAAWNGFCQLGGTFVSTVGMNSTTKVQASYPKCTVTVYATGTTNLSTLFSNALSSPLSNPFQANNDGSILFFASTTGCYDIVTSVSTSGGTPPMPNTFTYTDVCLGGGGGGGGGGGIGPGTVNQIAKFVTPTNVGNSTGFDDGASLVQWPNGLTVMGSAYGHLYPNSASGTTANYLACIDPTSITVAEVTTCPTSTTKALGIVHAGTSGITGNAQIASLGFDSCVFDNQTVVGDYAGPSSTVGGQCTDLGGTRPASIQGVGRVTTLNNGAGTAAIIDLGPWDLFAPGSSGAGQCSSNNANAYFSGGNLVCDQFVTDDGNGNLTAKSLGLTDVTQAGFYYLKQGTQPAAAPDNTRMDTVPSSVTTYTVIHPGVPCSTIGQTEITQSTSTDSKGHTVVTMQCGTAGGGGVEAQTNGVDNANCTAGVCPLINFTNSPDINATNPSGGVEQFHLAGFAQILNPTAPTLTVGGTPGTTSYCYKVVGWEDGSATGTYHTAASTQTCATTGNATLSSSPITLSGYGDTLYGPRCYAIYRTSSAGTPSSTGLIAGCVGKKFVDTGLAGDSSTAPTTNNTFLWNTCLGSSLPGIPSVPGAPCGVDGPPLAPTIYDDEFTWFPSVGTIADTNNTMWSWGNKGTATANLSNGVLTLNPDTTNAFEYVTHSVALPSPPYTFEAFITANVSNVTTATAACFIGLRESSSGKIYTGEVNYQGPAANSIAAGGGWIWIARNSTSNTPGGAVFTFQAYEPNSAYIKIQRSGSNTILSISPPWDGVNFLQWQTQATTTIFTTAPDQLILGGDGTGGSTTCSFDYVRRTQ